jgi:hypothetical protein
MDSLRFVGWVNAIRLGVTLYFVIPRAPNFSFPSDTVFLADESTVGFSRTPANFSFTGDIRMIGEYCFHATQTPFSRWLNSPPAFTFAQPTLPIRGYPYISTTSKSPCST